MKTKIIIVALVLLATLKIQSQSLNPTSNISLTGAADTFKAGYTFSYSTAGTPWNGALISYGGFPTNNYDTQISSDYGPNGGNHISYRTKNGDNNTWNSWNELAIRGTNTFVGDQNINGKLAINLGTTSDKFQINQGGTTRITASGDGVIAWGVNADYGYLSWDAGTTIIGGLTGKSLVLASNGVRQVTVAENGNMGIGTKSPTSKLTVAGNIESREVKVTVNAGADFVFEKDYNLPSLESLDKFIKENKHLPEIASAKEMQKDGINLSEMNIKLLQKIEELTLYTIEQQKNTQKLMEVIETLNVRLEAVEKK
ncbi:autotransporter outer membrane beta-barrel domain-containing protein [Flavobacterium collinsii]|uniref:Peptidase S74 domain-containing protein n=1 Tax=Flavobacterium collinsii TaxID=1114861 RepID=A0ABN7EJH8_9FLAO|nr:tail fiber protein [Flavobacterium collinsii]CAA9198698.1 hypothetical protein FLACOL7796_02278 [Flavobacterium collinsii]